MRSIFKILNSNTNLLRKACMPGIYSCRRKYNSDAEKVVSFYDEEVSKYGNKTIDSVTIHDLLQFGRPPLSSESLISSANHSLMELPPRLAKRVLVFQNLPFIVGINPHLTQVYKLYYQSFEMLRKYPKVLTKEEDAKFTNTLLETVESYAEIIPKLAQGFRECRRYLSDKQITQFLNDMIGARISIRLIAEQHLALHKSDLPENIVGILDTKLNPGQLFKTTSNIVHQLCEVNYGKSPPLIFDGHTDATFQYVPVHLEYIAIELLKNAFRATVECEANSELDDLPPVVITVASEKEHVCIRIRDQGGGIPAKDLKRIFDYSYTTVPSFDEDDNSGIFDVQTRLAMQTGVGGPMAGLGYGLPMTKVYAEYFGGTLNLQSLEGYGTDVLLTLPNLTEEHQTLPI